MKTNRIDLPILDLSINHLLSQKSVIEALDLNNENSRAAFIEDAVDEYEYLFVA